MSARTWKTFDAHTLIDCCCCADDSKFETNVAMAGVTWPDLRLSIKAVLVSVPAAGLSLWISQHLNKFSQIQSWILTRNINIYGNWRCVGDGLRLRFFIDRSFGWRLLFFSFETFLFSHALGVHNSGRVSLNLMGYLDRFPSFFREYLGELLNVSSDVKPRPQWKPVDGN